MVAAFSGDKDSKDCLSTVLTNASPERIHLAEASLEFISCWGRQRLVPSYGMSFFSRRVVETLSFFFSFQCRRSENAWLCRASDAVERYIAHGTSNPHFRR